MDVAYGLLCGPPAAELHSGEPEQGGGGRGSKGTLGSFAALSWSLLDHGPKNTYLHRTPGLEPLEAECYS